MIKEVKNTVSCTCVIEDLNVEDICGMFYENELQTGFKQFRVEKVVKKGYRCSGKIMNYFVSCINKKRYYIKMSYYREPSYSRNKIKVK